MDTAICVAKYRLKAFFAVQIIGLNLKTGVRRKAAKMFGNDFCHLTIFFFNFFFISISGLIVKKKSFVNFEVNLWQKNPLLLSILMYWEILEVFLNSNISFVNFEVNLGAKKILFITVLWSFLKCWILRQKNWPLCFIQVTYSKIGKHVIQFLAIQY